MSGKGKDSSLAPVFGSDDGFLYVRKIEDDRLSDLLAQAMARIEGYKVETREGYYAVTMKITFPAGVSYPQAKTWAWQIAKTAHPSLYNERNLIAPNGDGLQVFIMWNTSANAHLIQPKNNFDPRF